MSTLNMNDIRVLTILITKKVCTHENVQLYTERNNKEYTWTVTGKSKIKHIKQQIINKLCANHLISMHAPKRSLRHLYLGQWEINQKILKEHPQYDEIRMQIALGTSTDK